MSGRISSGRTVTEAPDRSLFKTHTHSDHEIFLFISGDAGYSVEGNLYPLRSGDLMVMRKSEAHFLNLRGPARYERIVVNFDPGVFEDSPGKEKLLRIFDDRPLGVKNRFEARLFPDNHWLLFMERICAKEDRWEKKIWLSALLEELSDCFDRVGEAPRETPSAPIVDYINRHLFEPISLDGLGAVFYLSRSQLNRVFKRDTGSTVYSYVLTKRLLNARRLLGEGVEPKKAAAQSGFDDYVTFYKAYRKKYARSPKTDLKK